MATCTVTTDERHVDDERSGASVMGQLQPSDLAAASWGVSWEPNSWLDRVWLDDIDDPPLDEEPCASAEAQGSEETVAQADDDANGADDGTWSPYRFDAYGEDVRRLRRLLIGG